MQVATRAVSFNINTVIQFSLLEGEDLVEVWRELVLFPAPFRCLCRRGLSAKTQDCKHRTLPNEHGRQAGRMSHGESHDESHGRTDVPRTDDALKKWSGRAQ